MSEKGRFFDFYGRLSDAKVPELPKDFDQFREQMGVEEQAKKFYEQLRENVSVTGVPESYEQFSTILPGKKQSGNPVVGFDGMSGGGDPAGRREVARNGVGVPEGDRVVELPEVSVFARKPQGGAGVVPERLRTEPVGIAGAEAGLMDEGKANRGAGEERKSEPEGVPGLADEIPGTFVGQEPGFGREQVSEQVQDAGLKQAKITGLKAVDERQETKVLPEEGVLEAAAGQDGLDVLLERKRRLLEADGELIKRWKEREKLEQMLTWSGGWVPADDHFYEDHRERYAKAVGELNRLVRMIHTHPETKTRREAWRKRLAERDKTEGEYQKTLEPAVKDYVYRPSGFGGYNVPVFSKDAGEHRYLNQAKKLREDTLKLLEAPSRYEEGSGWKNWMKGSRDTFTNSDFWTVGVLEIVRGLDVMGVHARALKNEEGRRLEDFLSPGELALLDSYVDFLNAVDERADDLSLGYEIGRGTPEVVSDMLLSLISGGAGKVASGAAKKVLGDWVKKRVSKGLAKRLAKGVGHLTGEGVRTVVTTTIDPRTYGRIMRRAVAPERDAEGSMLVDERGLPVFSSWTDVLLEGGRDVLAENWANGMLDRLKPVAGRYVLKKSGAGEAFEALAKLKPGRQSGKVWGNLVKQVLQDELLAPVVEAWYEKGIKALTGNPEELREFGTVEEQLKFFGTLMPVLMLKGGVKAGGVLKAEGRYRKSREQVGVLLQECGLSRQEADVCLIELEGMSAGEVAAWAAPVVKQAGWLDAEKGKELYEAFGDFNRNKSVCHLLAGMEPGRDGSLKPTVSGETGGVDEVKGNIKSVVEGDRTDAGQFPDKGNPKRGEKGRLQDAGSDSRSVQEGSDAGGGDVPGRKAERTADVARKVGKERLEAGQVTGGQAGTPENGGVQRGTFHREQADFPGKPGEAVRVLMQQREGQIEGVFRRKELGDVDLVWSAGKGDYGLVRILKGMEGVVGADELADRIAGVVGNGKLVRNGKRRVTVQGEGFEADVRREGHRGWRLYDFRPVRKKGAVVPAGGRKQKRAVGKGSGVGQGVTGEVSGIDRDRGLEDGRPVDVREESERVKLVTGLNVREAEGFLDGLMKNGEPFSWTGLLSRKNG